MIRSSFAAKGIGLCLILLGSLACGDKPPPKPPETTPSSTDGGDSASAGDTDGGTASAGGGDGGGTENGGGGDKPAAAAGLAMPSGTAKLNIKTKAALAIEVKSDGAVTNGGKPAGKIAGMELQDDKGKAQLKVDGDNITNGDGGPYAKFDGDDLVAQNGVKYNIADDGAVSSTDDKGKKANLGKSEGVGPAKRAALLAAAFVMWGQKPPAAKGEAKKPDGKKGGKPAGKK